MNDVDFFYMTCGQASKVEAEYLDIDTDDYEYQQGYSEESDPYYVY